MTKEEKDEKIAGMMSRRLRNRRALALLFIKGYTNASNMLLERFHEETCPACEGQGQRRNEYDELRIEDIIKRCPICRGFGSVPRGVARFYRGQKEKLKTHPKSRARWRPPHNYFHEYGRTLELMVSTKEQEHGH